MRTRSARTANWRQAERAAAAWESELRERGLGESPGEITWERFRVLFEDLRLRDVPWSTARNYTSAFASLEEVLGATWKLGELSRLDLEGIVAAWRRKPLAGSTIRLYLTSLRTALEWAKEVGHLDHVPGFPRPRESRLPRGRPLTHRECWAVLRACRTVRPRDWRGWVRILHCQWLSGLRISEACRLSWDHGPVRVDLDARPYPVLRFEASGQKGGRAEAVTVTPDFARWLARTPPGARRGLVCPPPKNYVFGVLRAVGEASGVVVDAQGGRYASSHDMRRTFGTRWSYRVKPLTLQRMMRHQDIRTTLRYYVDQDEQLVGNEIWGAI